MKKLFTIALSMMIGVFALNCNAADAHKSTELEAKKEEQMKEHDVKKEEHMKEHDAKKEEHKSH